MGPITCGYLVNQIGSLWGALAMGPHYMWVPSKTDWIFMGSPGYGPHYMWVPSKTDWIFMGSLGYGAQLHVFTW